MTDHYVRQDGIYIGGFSGTTPADATAINLGDNPPADSRQVWLFPGWSEIPGAGEVRRAEIMEALAAIDAASARPLRAILVGTATDGDRARLAELEEQAATLRIELSSLEAQAEA
ncbi:hypothetical protein ACM792_28260 [Metapseudomonas otitidis]|uniref:hypothetical protein n=1 Tax=Metapseudomonas otitidis TaxID=319939 RepID=UPI0039FBC1DA